MRKYLIIAISILIALFGGVTLNNYTDNEAFEAPGTIWGVSPIDRSTNIMGSSMTANSTAGFTAAADTDFGILTLTVPQFDTAANDYGNFSFEWPSTFGSGGTYTVTFHFYAINAGASSGNVVGGLRLADSIAGVSSATAREATATFVANDVEYKSGESSAITIYGTPASSEICYGQFYVDDTSTVDEDPYITLLVITFEGK